MMDHQQRRTIPRRAIRHPVPRALFEPRSARAWIYDLISLVYTLEHLADPFEALRSAAEGLRPGGLLFVEVPDALAFRLKPGDDDIFNACHLWMFDPVSLAQLLARYGFELFALERTHTVRGHYGLMALAGRR